MLLVLWYRALPPDKKAYFKSLGEKGLLAWRHGYASFGLSLASATDVPQPPQPSESIVPAQPVELSLILPSLECKFEKGLQRILKEQRNVSSCNKAKEKEEDTLLENCSQALVKDQGCLVQDSKRDMGVSQDLFCNGFPEGASAGAEMSSCDVVTFSPPLAATSENNQSAKTTRLNDQLDEHWTEKSLLIQDAEQPEVEKDPSARLFPETACYTIGTCVCAKSPSRDGALGLLFHQNLVRTLKIRCWSKNKEKSDARKLLESGSLVLCFTLQVPQAPDPADLDAPDEVDIDMADLDKFQHPRLYLHAGYVNYLTWKMTVLPLYEVDDFMVHNPVPGTQLLQTLGLGLAEPGTADLNRCSEEFQLSVHFFQKNICFKFPYTVQLFEIESSYDTMLPGESFRSGYVNVKNFDRDVESARDVLVWQGSKLELEANKKKMKQSSTETRTRTKSKSSGGVARASDRKTGGHQDQNDGNGFGLSDEFPEDPGDLADVEDNQQGGNSLSDALEDLLFDESDQENFDDANDEDDESGRVKVTNPDNDDDYADDEIVAENLANDPDQSGGSDKCWDEALDELDRVNAEAEAEKAAGHGGGSSGSSSSSSSSSSDSSSSSSTKRRNVRGPRAQPATLLPTELRKLLPKEGAGGEITIFRDPDSYGYRVMYPSGGMAFVSERSCGLTV
eukprot:s2018_g14.t1